MKKVIKIIILLVFAIAWMFCIFKLSGMSSKNSNGKSIGIIGVFIEDALEITNDYGITDSHPNDSKLAHASELINAPMRKVIHASVYFVLGFFIMIIFSILFEHNNYLLAVLLTLILCIIFAGTDEFHQTFVNGRTGQLLDVIIDSAGAVVGIAFYTTYEVAYKLGFRKGLKKYKIDEDDNI